MLIFCYAIENFNICKQAYSAPCNCMDICFTESVAKACTDPRLQSLKKLSIAKGFPVTVCLPGTAFAVGSP